MGGAARWTLRVYLMKTCSGVVRGDRATGLCEAQRHEGGQIQGESKAGGAVASRIEPHHVVVRTGASGVAAGVHRTAEVVGILLLIGNFLQTACHPPID